VETTGDLGGNEEDEGVGADEAMAASTEQQQQQQALVPKVVVGRRAPHRKWLVQYSFILKVGIKVVCR
jgi:hypothetical protein